MKTSFGDILGKTDFVRQPTLPDAVSLGYLMLLTRKSNINLTIALADQDFEALQADIRRRKFVEFLG